MGLLFTDDELSKSGTRRGVLLQLEKRALFLNGLVKIRNYMLQVPPSGDGLPFLLIPYSETLRTLFTFTVACKHPFEFSCEDCFYRNECMRKVLTKIEKVAKQKYPVIEIDTVLQDKAYALSGYYNVAIDLIRKLCVDLGAPV
jgi:hypothetical protein